MCDAFLDCPNWPITTGGSSNDGPIRAVQECSTHTLFLLVPRNTTKLTTRGDTSPDGVEMTLIREKKSIHDLRG